MLPFPIKILINQFTRLPGIGPRQAARFAFYLLRNREDIDLLINALDSARQNARLCQECFLPSAKKHNESGSSCVICENPKRDRNLICIVEKEADALSFEKSAFFDGRYYVLGGFINPLDENAFPQMRLNSFIDKIKKNYSLSSAIEAVLAFSPRKEGDFTSFFIEEKLKELNGEGYKIKTTRLGRGLSSGAELEYADQETIKNALEGRK